MEKRPPGAKNGFFGGLHGLYHLHTCTLALVNINIKQATSNLKWRNNRRLKRRKGQYVAGACFPMRKRVFVQHCPLLHSPHSFIGVA
jgi:hypothetical protein